MAPNQSMEGTPYSLFEEDVYCCNLGKELLTIAARDLKETKEVRDKTLRALREWIIAEDDVQKCRMDANFLLRFLRMKKFQLDDTMRVLRKYLTMRIEHPSWFQNLDIMDDGINDLVTKGFIFVLPERDHMGRRVIFNIHNENIIDGSAPSDLMRASILTYETLLEDEENQVQGFTYIYDLKGVGLQFLTLFSPSEIQQIFSCCEQSLPMRHKEINFANVPLTIWAFFEMAKSLLSNKVRKRLQVFSDTKKLVKKFPVRILPKEYGGVVPMEDMISSWKKELMQKRNNVLALDQMQIVTTKPEEETSGWSIRSWWK